MSKTWLHLFLLGMVIVFTTINPSIAHESGDDDSPYVIPLFGEKPLEQNPLLLREPTWRHLLQGEVEEEGPFAGEKLPEDEEEKLGRLKEQALGISPFYDDERESVREMRRSILANPPSISPFSNMRKPSKGKVFEPAEMRQSDSFYVTKPRERMPLIMRHRKIPPRSLLGEHEPQHFLDVMRRPQKPRPPHEHKPGYEHP